MPRFRYVGPATLPVELAAGPVTDDQGVVHVDDTLARSLADQPDIWQPVKAANAKKED